MRTTSRQSALGVDLGTSAVKVVSLGSDGELLAEPSAGYGVTALHPMTQEWRARAESSELTEV